MIYFIPAWYKENKWCENEQSWHARRTYSEFDETIKQIQLVHRNLKADYRILLLPYSPNFRHFLHRQGMYRANYWSCFDAMQQIKRTKISTLSFHDLKWPEGIEFVYSPFAIVAFLYGRKYAKIEFGEDGNMIAIDMYENDVICRRNYYDDRGFVSCTIVYINGQADHQDFLGEDGGWRVRNYFGDDHCEINPKYSKYTIHTVGSVIESSYLQDSYPSLEALIREVFGKYVYYNNTGNDKFFVAIHKIHMGLLKECLHDKCIISTVFENRYPLDYLINIKDFIVKSQYLITDSKEVSKQIKNVIGYNSKTDKCIVRDISPYDARADFGISQQLNVQNILVPVDGIDDIKLEQIIVECAEYMSGNALARVHIFSRSTDWQYETKMSEKIALILERNGYDKRWMIPDTRELDSENTVDAHEEEIDIRFFIDKSLDERNISKCVNEQRVILDMRNTVDVFLFITALSKGVPRISFIKDEFLLHKRTGYYLNDFSQIHDILSYYLDNMEIWNEALIENYELGLKYTTDILVEAWKEVLEISE